MRIPRLVIVCIGTASLASACGSPVVGSSTTTIATTANDRAACLALSNVMSAKNPTSAQGQALATARQTADAPALWSETASLERAANTGDQNAFKQALINMSSTCTDMGDAPKILQN